MSDTLGDSTWQRYCASRHTDTPTGVTVDVSGAGFPDGYPDAMAVPLAAALSAMAALERGRTANPDEGRRVGHYWLRAPGLAPDPDTTRDIEACWTALADFRTRIRGGPHRFTDLVHVGLGGSATGPQLLCDAWRGRPGGLRVHFLDNADPDGVDRVLGALPGGPERTLVSVVSKSGLTPTPWRVVRELASRYADAGVDFPSHAVATTMRGSDLDAYAHLNGWLETFPLWDWVGGRTSVTSAVGLLPAALAGADTTEFLAGAAAMDRATRRTEPRRNPAALLALAWFWLGNGRGDRSMVVLPYRDALTVLPRFVQQLVMESLGKRLDRAGRVVHQGLTVYGHKGVTDQHAYLQQLKDGRTDAFVTLVGTHRGEAEDPVGAEPVASLADHLYCGLVGTLAALRERDRPVLAITTRDYAERSLGALVALYERAVGLYAELIDVNAYHQPGVDKNTALPFLELQRDILRRLTLHGEPVTAVEVARSLGCPERADLVHRLLDHLAVARPDLVTVSAADGPDACRYAPAEGGSDD